ncbi:MAG: hypothetical protein OEZ43_07705 [Gammaproteobacteria bacterium]|nr:hypothetical protein [Gammaproteobacteria bacterium]
MQTDGTSGAHFLAKTKPGKPNPKELQEAFNAFNGVADQLTATCRDTSMMSLCDLKIILALGLKTFR